LCPRVDAFNVTKPTHPGQTGLTTLALDDRLAIFNLLSAYTRFANCGDLEGWSSTFTKDATYRVSAPGMPGEPVPIGDFIAAEGPAFADYRRLRVNPEAGERMIYRIAVPCIIEQTVTEATVSCELMIVRAQPQGPQPYIMLTGTFFGTVVKQDRCWRIHRWSIETTRIPDANGVTPPKSR
jgi:hypothetical protein